MKFLLFLLFVPTLIAADELCPICRKVIRESTVNQMLCCGHSYHAVCLGGVLQSSALCPICRVPASFHTDRFRALEHDRCERPKFANMVTHEELSGLLETINDETLSINAIRVIYVFFELLIQRFPNNSEEMVITVRRIREKLNERISAENAIE